jgi:hypothetical protein
MKKLCSQWTDFHEILYLSIFPKSVLKIQVSLKSDKNNVKVVRLRYVPGISPAKEPNLLTKENKA